MTMAFSMIKVDLALPNYRSLVLIKCSRYLIKSRKTRKALRNEDRPITIEMREKDKSRPKMRSTQKKRQRLSKSR